MTFRFSKRLVVLVSALLLTAPIAFAQSQATTGVIEGRVTDESDAVLPGVTVVLTNMDTNQTRTLATDESGRYRGVLLPLGNYRVAVSLQGFASHAKEGIKLGVGQTLTINFQLAQGTFEDEIVVQADTPVVETSRTDNAVTIDGADQRRASPRVLRFDHTDAFDIVESDAKKIIEETRFHLRHHGDSVIQMMS